MYVQESGLERLGENARQPVWVIGGGARAEYRCTAECWRQSEEAALKIVEPLAKLAKVVAARGSGSSFAHPSDAGEHESEQEADSQDSQRDLTNRPKPGNTLPNRFARLRHGIPFR